MFLTKRVYQFQISKTIDEDGSSQLIGLPETETKMSLLANLFMSEG